MDKAEQMIVRARTALILSEPFFGALALRLRCQEDPACETLWTDGLHLGYNPAFVETLSQAELKGVVCHEVLHCSNGHPWRREHRDMKKWNDACDYAINPIVEGAGMTLPDGCLNSPQFKGKSAELIYSLLPNSESGKQGGGQGRGQQGKQGQAPGQGGSTYGPGEVRDAPAEGAADQEADWKIATAQAAKVAKSQGKLPAELDRWVGEALRPKVDWKAILHRFVQQAAKLDYSWRRPNPRYVASRLYLPVLHSEQMPPLVVVVDTSGSIGSEELKQFAGEISAIMAQVKPERVHVIYCDARVQRVEEYEPGDDLQLRPKGGGGTNFAPPFEWVQKEGLEPACLIYLTDGWGSFPTEAPPYPTLWIMTTDKDQVPFGEVVRLEL